MGHGPHDQQRHVDFTFRASDVHSLKFHPLRIDQRLFTSSSVLSTSTTLAEALFSHLSCHQAPYNPRIPSCRSPTPLMDRQSVPPNFMTPVGGKQVQLFREQSDQPQYVCTEATCGKRFGRKEHLARHMRARMIPKLNRH